MGSQERFMKILVIDIGGTNVKLLASGQETPRKFPSGPDLTPEKMVAGVQDATKDWDYEAISIGFPGPVLCGQPMTEPVNLGPGWMGFDFEKAFGKPVKVINDAAMPSRPSEASACGTRARPDRLPRATAGQPSGGPFHQPLTEWSRHDDPAPLPKAIHDGRRRQRRHRGERGPQPAGRDDRLRDGRKDRPRQPPPRPKGSER